MELKKFPLGFLHIASIDLDEQAVALDIQRRAQPDNLHFKPFIRWLDNLWLVLADQRFLLPAEEEANRRAVPWMPLFSLCRELLPRLKAVAVLLTDNDQVFIRDQIWHLVDGQREKPAYPLKAWRSDALGSVHVREISEFDHAAILKPYYENLDSARVALMDKVIHSPEFGSLMSLREMKFTPKHVQLYEEGRYDGVGA